MTMKKLTLLLAVLMSLTMAFTGCKKDEINQDPVEITGLTETTPATTEATTTEATTTVATTEATTEATTTAATTKATTTVATTKKPVETTVATTKATETTPATTTVTTPPASNIDSSKAGKYVYNTLNADEKKLYNEIFNAVKNFEPEAKLSKTYDGATITKVYQDVFFQEPSLFWFRGENKQFQTGDTVPLKYWISKAAAANRQAEIDAATNRILNRIPAGASDIQKLKIIHDSICLKATFQKDTNDTTTTIYGPLVAGPTQCEGYAKVVSYLCSKAGVESVRITGRNAKQLTHAWNKIKIGGKWYNFDTTWDDPQGNTNPNYFTYNYFLVPDSQVNGLSHFPDTSFTAPTANSLNANYHVVNGMYANTGDEAVKILTQQLVKASKTKAPIASVKCANKAAYDAIMPKLANIVNEANKTAPNKIVLEKTKFARDEKLLVFNLKPAY